MSVHKEDGQSRVHAKLWFAAPGNDNDDRFPPAGAARAISPTFLELVAHFKAANENATLDDAVAAALREFYVANSALITLFEIYQHVSDEGDRKDALTQVLGALHRMFWAAQIPHVRGNNPDVPPPPPPPPPSVEAFALRDPLAIPRMDIVANIGMGKSSNVTRMPLVMSDNSNAAMPGIIRNILDVEFGDDRGATTIGTNAKRRRADWLMLAVDNTRAVNKNDLIIKHHSDDAILAGDGNRSWTVAELRNDVHPAYWANRTVPSGNRNGQVFISFNLPFEQESGIVKRLLELLVPRLVHAGFDRPFVFTDRTHGTTYGKEFVPEVVERISSAIAGIIIQSAPYFASDYCRLELALLIQRSREQGMPLYPVFAGHHSFGDVPVLVPSRPGFAEGVRIATLGDDRKGHPDWKPEMARQPLQSLIDIDHKSALTERLAALVEDLMRRLTGDSVK